MKKITGILTNCLTNKESIIELEYEIIETDKHKPIFKIFNGVTGYESFYIDDYAQENMPKFGWMACAGTQNKYDKLFIPAEEMKKALETMSPKSTLILEKQRELKNFKDQRNAKKNDLYHLDIKIEKLEKEFLSILNNKGE